MENILMIENDKKRRRKKHEKNNCFNINIKIVN